MILIPTYKLMAFNDDDVTFVFTGGVYDLSLGKLRHWLIKSSDTNLDKSGIYVRRTK